MYSLYQDRSRVYFDIEIGQKKEGRVTFELVSNCPSTKIRTKSP